MSNKTRVRSPDSLVAHRHPCGDECPCSQPFEPLCFTCELCAVLKRRVARPEMSDEEAIARLAIAIVTFEEAAR